jgi:hypothetical protein
MGTIKKIGEKSYNQDANGDWYEVESPVQKEPENAKVINGVTYYKDDAGDWYEGEKISQKKNDGQPSKTGGQEPKTGGVSQAPSPSQSKLQEEKPKTKEQIAKEDLEYEFPFLTEKININKPGDIMTGQQRQQMAASKVKADKLEEYRTQELPKQAKAEKEKAKQASLKPELGDQFNPVDFATNDIATYSGGASLNLDPKAPSADKFHQLNQFFGNDASNVAPYFDNRVKAVDKQIAQIKQNPMLWKNLNQGKSDIQEIEKLKDYKLKLAAASNKLATDYTAWLYPDESLERKGEIKRKIAGDNSVNEEIAFKEKGIPLTDEQKFNNAKQGVDVERTRLENDYRDIPTEQRDDTYFQRLAQVNNMDTKLINQFPDYRKKQVGMMIAQLAAQDPNIDASSRIGFIPHDLDEKTIDYISKTYNQPKELFEGIQYGDIPNQFIGNIPSKIATTAGLGVVTATTRLLGTALGIDSDRLTHINNMISGIPASIYGDDPYKKTSHPQSIIDINPTSSTYLQNIPNPKAGKSNYNLTTVSHGIVEGAANFAAFMGGLKLATKGVQAAEWALMQPLTAEAEQSAAMTAYMTITNYENNYKRANEVLGKDASEAGKATKAMIDGYIDKLAFDVLPKEKLFLTNEAKAIVDKELSPYLRNLTIKDINRNVLQTNVQKAVEGIVNTAKEIGHITGATSAAEISKGIINSIVGEGKPKEYMNEAWEGVKHTMIETPLSMALPLGVMEVVNAKQHSSFFKENVYSAGLEPNKYIALIQQELGKGNITAEEANSRMEVVKIMHNIVQSTPDINPKTNQKFTHNQQVEYAYNRLKESGLRAKALAHAEDPAISSIYLADAQDLADVRKAMLESFSKPTKQTEAPKEKTIPQQKVDIEKQRQDELEKTPENADKINAKYDAEIEKLSNQEKPIEFIMSKEDLDKTQSIIDRVGNNESINEGEMKEAEDILYDTLDKNPDSAHLIEPLILKLQNHENITKTETVQTTERKPVEGTFAAKRKIEIKPALEQSEGSTARVTLADGTTAEGTLRIQDGNYVLEVEGQEPIVIGETAITNRDLKVPEGESPIELDENGNVKSATFETKDGHRVTITDPEKALDLGIQLSLETVGEIPDEAFDRVYEDVIKEDKIEVPIEKPKIVEKLKLEAEIPETGEEETPEQKEKKDRENTKSKLKNLSDEKFDEVKKKAGYNSRDIVDDEDIANDYHDALKVPEPERTEKQNKIIEAVNEALGTKKRGKVKKGAKGKAAKFVTEHIEEPTDENPEPPTEEKTGEEILKELENKGTKSSDEKSLNELAEKNKGNKIKKKIIEQARKAIKTLKSIFPNMDIHLHENEQDYNDVMEKVKGKKSSGGNFAYTKNADGTYSARIDINLNGATSTTVAHEVTHAILFKAFGENQEVFQSFRDKISKVLGSATDKGLQKFADSPFYKAQGVTAEEYLSELSGLLSSKTINPLTLSKIASAINEFVSKVTGGKFIPFENVNDAKDVVEFFDKISSAIKKGNDLTDIGKGKIPETPEQKIKSKSQENKEYEYDIPMSALNVLYGDSEILPKPPKKTDNATVAKQIQEIAANHWGGNIITSSNVTPEQEGLITKNGVNEAIKAYEASGKNAADWYSTAIETAIAVAGVVHPELNSKEIASKVEAFGKEEDPVAAAQMALRMALAITSQNLNVDANTKYAEEQFEYFKKNGKFDSSKEYGAKAPAISSNLDLANLLIDTLGLNNAEKFISQEFTVKQLEDAFKVASGKSLSIEGLRDDAVNGAAIFGPKIGQGFLQNLMGKFDPVTIDLWMRRTWGRWTGDVVGEGVTKDRMYTLYSTVKDAIRNKELKIDLPKEFSEYKPVQEKNKGGKLFWTMNGKFGDRIDIDLEFKDKIHKVAKEISLKANSLYKAIHDIPMSKEMYDKFVSGEISYVKTAEKLKLTRDKLGEKYLDYKAKEKAKKNQPLPKGEWIELQDQKEGRTYSPTNEQISDKKPKWGNAAKNIVDELNPIDSPTNMDRRVITRVVNNIRKGMAEKGYDVTNADVQALLWYPEKDIWAKLRGEEESNLKLSYDDQFIKLATERGLGEQAETVANEIRSRRTKSNISTPEQGGNENIPTGIAEEKQKIKTNDTENIPGLPSKVGVGEEPVTTEPIKGAGAEEISPSRSVQALGAEGKGKAGGKEGIKSKAQFDEDVKATAKALEDVSKIKQETTKNDEFLKEWGGHKVGDTFNVTNVDKQLPESSATPSNGNYTLEIIPVLATDLNYSFANGKGIIKNGTPSLSREHWEWDNEDGYQTEQLNMIKKGFDTKEREPIIVEKTTDGMYVVVDGHHRLTIAKELGRNNILALVREGTTEKNPKTFKSVSESYHEALKVPEQKRTEQQKQLISSVNETLGVSELPKQKGVGVGEAKAEIMSRSQMPMDKKISDMKDILKEYVDEGKSLDEIKDILKDEFGDYYDDVKGIIDQAHQEMTTTGIKNAVTERERGERGLEEIEVEAKRSFGKVFDDAKQMIANGVANGLTLAAEIIKNPRPLKAEESAVLLIDRMRISNEYNKKNAELIEAQENGETSTADIIQSQMEALEEEMDLNDEAARKSGYEQGLGLAARRMLIAQDYSLVTQMNRLKAANGGKEVPKQYQEQLQTLITQLEEANNKLEKLEKTQAGTEKQTGLSKVAKVSRTPEQFEKEKQSIKSKIATKWGQTLTRMKSVIKGRSQIVSKSAVTPQKQAQLESIVKDVNDMVKLYAESGVTDLKKIIDNVHQDLSSSISGLDRVDIEDIVLGKYDTQKPKTPLTPAKIQALANVREVKTQIDFLKEELKNKQRSGIEKGMDYLHGWHRFGILSGVPSSVKIGTAALTRGIVTRAENLVGQALSLIPGIRRAAKRAPREGGINRSAEAKAFSSWFDKMTKDDIRRVMKTGISELDYLYGAKQPKAPAVPKWMEFFGRMHSAIKLLPKRAEFFRSLEMRTEQAIKEGKNPNDAVVQQELGVAAYNDALRSVFMQENILSEGYQGIVRKYEKTQPALASALKFLLPIVKVPSNYVAEQSSYVPIVALVKAITVGIQGRKGMTSEQADYFMRALKKGSIGTAFIALGFFNPGNFGGYYTGRRKRDDLEAGDIELFGVKLPHFMLHTPLLEMLQVGATMRRAAESQLAKGEEPSETLGIYTGGIPAVLKGQLTQIPFFGTSERIMKTLDNQSGAVDKMKEYGSSIAQSIIEPQLMQNIADWTDMEDGKTVKRESKGLVEKLKEGAPGFKKTLKQDKSKFTDKEYEEFSNITEKGLNIPELNKRTTYKIKIDTEHPDGHMTEEEYYKFIPLQKEYVKDAYKKFYSTHKSNFDKLQKMIDAVPETPEEKAKMNALKDAIQNKIDDVHNDAIKAAKRKIGLHQK